MSIAVKVVERLRSARRVLALTGAGVSAESGVPTFRSAGGLWTQGDAMRLATPEGFAEDPTAVWAWYDLRRQGIAQVQSNAAHRTLAQMERAHPAFLLSTQNVDDLHRAAGSRRMVELHGNIWRVRCTRDAAHRWEDRRAPLPEIPPHCPTCGALARPDVLWFGESYGPELDETIDFIVEGVDVVLLVGTSGGVATPHWLAERAQGLQAYVIEINLERTGYSPLADAVLLGRAGEILPQLWAQVTGDRRDA